MSNGWVPIDLLPPDVQNQVVDRCQSNACQVAKDQLVILRNRILALCSQLATEKSKLNTYGVVAGALTAALAGAVTAAATTPWPINLVLWIVASLLATALVVMLILVAHEQNLINILSSAVKDRQDEFEAAVKTMQQECPEQCRSDATLPTCGA
jgi:Flp pilus assembly protein TadB